jgi:hypothetical protein
MLEAILLGIFDLDQSLTILAEWQIGVKVGRKSTHLTASAFEG